MLLGSGQKEAKMSLPRRARAFQGSDVHFPAFERARPISAASWKKTLQQLRDECVSGYA